MKKIDSFILKKFQKSADFLQITFGITCFSLSRYLIIAWAAVDVFVHCLGISDTGVVISFSPFVIVPMLLCVLYIVYINQAEKECKRAPGCKNFLELKFQFARLMLVFMFTVSVVFFAFSSSAGGLKGFAEHYVRKFVFIVTTMWLFGLYFASCTPLPPQKSKLKKFVEKLTTVLSEIKTQPA